jgi:hypothetical protein
MSDVTIRSAYPTWPRLDRQLRAAVARLTPDQLAFQPGPDRWPLWATIGHLACQRVFWLCVVAGAPGQESTPFPDSGSNCPGDDDLEHVLSADDLVAALEVTFGIVETCLDTWSLASLMDVIRHPEWGDDWVHTRGEIVQRVLVHDATHIAELNEAFTTAGLPTIDPWSD